MQLKADGSNNHGGSLTRNPFWNRRFTLVGLLAVALYLAVAAGASATSTLYVLGDYLALDTVAGKNNTGSVVWSGQYAYIYDSDGAAPDATASPICSTSGVYQKCDLTSINHVQLELRDGNDNFNLSVGTPYSGLDTSLPVVIWAGTGNNTITGSSVADNITGDSDTDTVSAGGGDDYVDAGTGNDTVNGGDGEDWIYGDSGVDTIDGDAGPDHLNGEGDGDYIYGGTDDDTISGGGGDDTISGEDDVDTITGNAGADQIFDGDGDDDVDGGDDGDHFFDGTGGDEYLGGSGGVGDDTIDFALATDDVTADIDGVRDDGQDGQDLIHGDIENIDGSLYDDTLTGNSSNNDLEGSNGDDTISGSGGSDSINGGYDNDTLSGDGGADGVTGDWGNDTIDGGTNGDIIDGNGDYDTVTYLSQPSADINLNLTTGSANDGTYYDAVAGFEFVITGNGNDTVVGSTSDNVISAGKGRNTVDGGGGTDDYISFDRLSSGVTADLQSGTVSGGASGTVTDIDHIFGSSYDDTLLGTSGANYIFSEAGNDRVNGREGTDLLFGGDDTDTVDYSDRRDALNITLDITADDGVIGENDNAVGFEAALGGGGDDYISAPSSSTTDFRFVGDDGNDTLVGANGADRLEGGDDNDEISPGSGNDTVIGGADRSSGGDSISYASASAGVVVDLSNTAQTATTGSESDALTGIEDVEGSGFSDTLTGNGEINVFTAGGGDDTLDLDSDDVTASEIDQANCGAGTDTALINTVDVANPDCEDPQTLTADPGPDPDPDPEPDPAVTETVTEPGLTTVTPGVTEQGAVATAGTDTATATSTVVSTTAANSTTVSSSRARISISGTKKQKPLKAKKRGVNAKVKCSVKGCKLRITGKIIVTVKGKKKKTLFLKSVSVTAGTSSVSAWSKLSKTTQKKLKSLLKKKGAKAKATLRATGTDSTGTSAQSSSGKSYVELKVTIKK